MKKEKKDNVFVKNGQKYLRMGDKAIPFDSYGKNGLPIIKPTIIKDKDENGKDRIRIKIPNLIIKYKINGERNI